MKEIYKHLSAILKCYYDLLNDQKKKLDDYDKTRLLSFDVIQIREKVKKLPPDVLDSLDRKSLKGFTGIRNHIVHAYDGVDEAILFSSIEKELPSFVLSIVEKVYREGNEHFIGQKIKVEIKENFGDHAAAVYEEVIGPSLTYQTVYIAGNYKCNTFQIVEVVGIKKGKGFLDDLFIAKVAKSSIKRD